MRKVSLLKDLVDVEIENPLITEGGIHLLEGSGSELKICLVPAKVKAVGSKIKSLKKGDRVIVDNIAIYKIKDLDLDLSLIREHHIYGIIG